MNSQAKALAQLLPDFLDFNFLGNTGKSWVAAMILILMVVFLLNVIKKILLTHGSSILSKIDDRWSDMIRDIIARTRQWFVWTTAIFLSSSALRLSERAENNFQRLFIVVLLVQLGIWGLALITRLMEEYISNVEQDPSRTTSMRVLAIIAKFGYLIILFLWGLDNFGINVGTLVTGLGIGGIAVALAVQSILSDLFASLTIVMDKPFVIGDFVVIGEFKGTVDHIGLKTTRIHSLTGEQLVFSNTDLLQSRIRNFQRMSERRVIFTLGVLYSTPSDKLKMVNKIIESAVNSQKLTRFDRSHFSVFADSSLNFEIVYFISTKEYRTYMNIQQEINFEIFERLNAEGIGFAFPSTSVYLETVPSKSSFSSKPLD
jgi:small-conductance mechanosensitive channel